MMMRGDVEQVVVEKIEDGVDKEKKKKRRSGRRSKQNPSPSSSGIFFFFFLIGFRFLIFSELKIYVFIRKYNLRSTNYSFANFHMVEAGNL